MREREQLEELFVLGVGTGSASQEVLAEAKRLVEESNQLLSFAEFAARPDNIERRRRFVTLSDDQMVVRAREVLAMQGRILELKLHVEDLIRAMESKP